jgi:hypothetical protein
MKVTKLGGMARMTCLMLMGSFTAIPSHAQVSVNIHIGEPPPVVVAAPPTMVLMPEPEMYVAVGVPYDIYFVSGHYYYLYEGHWFWGPRYGGPWTYVAVEKLPPGLRRYKVKQLHEFRDREYNGYRFMDLLSAVSISSLKMTIMMNTMGTATAKVRATSTTNS